MMGCIKEKPEGDYCEIIRVFQDSSSCPSLWLLQDDAKKPVCTKYEEYLTWDIAGHILKCEKCPK